MLESTLPGAPPADPFPDRSIFVEHSIESAPEDARRTMRAVQAHLGYVSGAVARMSASPHLLDGFVKANALFEACTLAPLEREVVVFVMATRNGCHLCVAMHTARVSGLGVDAELTQALRAGRELPEPRLEALRAFTVHVIETAGAVDRERLDAFLAQGYTPRNALEVVLGIGTYTMSTLGNRMTGAPVDEPLLPFA